MYLLWKYVSLETNPIYYDIKQHVPVWVGQKINNQPKESS